MESTVIAPNNKIYDSYEITYKEYKDEYLPDSAIECFKKPWFGKTGWKRKNKARLETDALIHKLETEARILNYKFNDKCICIT